MRPVGPMLPADRLLAHGEVQWGEAGAGRAEGAEGKAKRMHNGRFA